MTALERRCRRLLRAYPAWYRRERGDEMLGTALALLGLTASYLSDVSFSWSHFYSNSSGAASEFAFAVATLAVVGAAWFAPRPVAAVLALAAAAGYLLFWGDRVMAIQPAGLLVMLAVLVPGRHRLPRSWLSLAGAVLGANLLTLLAPAILPARPLSLSEIRRLSRFRPRSGFPSCRTCPTCWSSPRPGSSSRSWWPGRSWTRGRRWPWPST